MKKIGITGSIGAGKSFVGEILRLHEYEVLDADATVHDLYRENSALRAELVSTFGGDCLTASGVNRTFFANLIFTDDSARKKLESIVYPYLTAAVDDFFKAEVFEKKKDVKFVEAALLAKTPEIVNMLDEIWVVRAPEIIRLERLQKRGLSLEDAERRIQNQKNICFANSCNSKRVFFIENYEGNPSLKFQLEKLLKRPF